MDTLINALDVLYGIVGLLFLAGVGALMCMFAFVQVTARIAVWLDVNKAFVDRRNLQAEVELLRKSLDTLSSGDADPDVPLVTAIKVSEPRKPGAQRGD